MTEKLLRRPEVQARTGLARSTIYQKMPIGEFPHPVHIGTRAVAWPETEISAWIETCLSKREGK
jgi:prophage regulatory protein